MMLLASILLLACSAALALRATRYRATPEATATEEGSNRPAREKPPGSAREKSRRWRVTGSILCSILIVMAAFTRSPEVHRIFPDVFGSTFPATGALLMLGAVVTFCSYEIGIFLRSSAVSLAGFSATVLVAPEEITREAAQLRVAGAIVVTWLLVLAVSVPIRWFFRGTRATSDR